MRQTLTLLSTLLIAAPVWAQPAGRDLRILFNPDDYLAPVYSGRPSSGAPFVFFDDEPVRLLIRFANWSDESLALHAGGRSPAEAVSVRLYRLSASGPVDVPVRLNVEGEALLSSGSHESMLRWEDTMPIPGRWYLSIPMLVQTARLEPGTYELRLTQIHVSCAPRCGIQNHAGVFVFDITRPDDLPKRLDQLLRQADQAIERGNFTDADLPISTMLKLHPQASAAYQLLARRAERLENWKDAADAYERALELVETGRDSLRRHPEPQALIGALRTSAAEARGRQNKR